MANPVPGPTFAERLQNAFSKLEFSVIWWTLIVGALFGVVIVNLNIQIYNPFGHLGLMAQVALWAGSFLLAYLLSPLLSALVGSNSPDGSSLFVNLLIVAVFGALGGLASPAMNDKFIPGTSDLVILGALAAIGGTTILLNREIVKGDANKFAQTLGYAAICGLVWPIIFQSMAKSLGEGADALAKRNLQVISDLNVDLTQKVTALEKAPAADKLSTLSAITSGTGQGVEAAAKTLEKLPEVKDSELRAAVVTQTTQLAKRAVAIVEGVGQTTDSAGTGSGLRKLDDQLGVLQSAASANAELAPLTTALSQSPPRVYIQHCNNIELAERIRTALRDPQKQKEFGFNDGLIVPELEDICDDAGPRGTPPSEPEFRYYFKDDEPLVDNLIKLVNNEMGYTPPKTAFGSFVSLSAPPRMSTIELWLPATPPPGQPK